MRTTFLSLFFGFFSCLCFAQTNEHEMKNDLQYIKKLATTNKNAKGKVERLIYKSHFDAIEHRVERGYHNETFVLEPNYIDFINQSFQLIFDKNPQLKNQEFKFFLEKDNFPNAASTGSYLYFINTGLFTYTDNEEQFIAVLCHEVAHDYLNHREASITQQSEFEKDFNRELKSLKKKEFLKLIKSQDEVLKRKYDVASQSRKKEIEADSLGFILYSKLDISPVEYYNVLQNLQNFDEKETDEIQDSMYIYLFDLPGQAFKKKWLKIEKDDIFGGLAFTDHVDEDSIKSHPNIADRVEWIQNKFEISVRNERKEPSELFSKLKSKVADNYYETFYTNKEYGMALFNLIYRIQTQGRKPDSDKNLGFIFNQLYEGRLNYKFNKYVPQVDQSSDDKEFQTFTSFLWNLSNDELKFIGDYYTKKVSE